MDSPISLLTEFFGAEDKDNENTTAKPIDPNHKKNENSDDSTVSLSIEETESRTDETPPEDSNNNMVGTVLDESMEQVDDVLDRVYDSVASICSFISGGEPPKENTTSKTWTDDTVEKKNHYYHEQIVAKRVSFNLQPTYSDVKDFDDDDGDEEEEIDTLSCDKQVNTPSCIKNHDERPKRIQTVPPPLFRDTIKDPSADRGMGSSYPDKQGKKSQSSPVCLVGGNTATQHSVIASLPTLVPNTNTTATIQEIDENEEEILQVQEDRPMERPKVIIPNPSPRSCQGFYDFDEIPFDEAFHPTRPIVVADDDYPDTHVTNAFLTNKNKDQESERNHKIDKEEIIQDSSSPMNHEDSCNLSDYLGLDDSLEGSRSSYSKSNIPSTTSSLSSNLTRERMKKMQERKKRERRCKEVQMNSEDGE